MSKYMFDNILSWTLAGTTLFITIHLFACIWVKLHFIKLAYGVETIEFEETGRAAQYFESLYLMTTTISTVGYGNAYYHGYFDNTGSWAAEMTFLIFAQWAGIILFSSVTREIFAYKKLFTVKELVRQRLVDMESFFTIFYSKDAPRGLPQDLTRQLKEHIE